MKYIPETIATEVVSEDPAAPVLPAVAPLKMKELVNILGNMRNSFNKYTYALPPSGVPGLCTRVFNWTPSGTGPSVLAGHEPGGLTALSPKGRFPVWSPLNLVKSDPANWQWNNPLSSAFLGSD